MKSFGMSIILTSSALLASRASRAQDKERSIAAFMEASKVFKHPRCLNCHPAADYPTQGDDLHRHIMNVQRGANDHGVVGERCETCHREANYIYSEVPGAPKWALAPRSLAWQSYRIVSSA
ncbi:MAG: hypothetical protein H7318_05765 [Oligoflexus sp.]|nr:hypothetical protein [Oligoflexus sp.]